MQMKIKEKMIAVVMAFAMMFTFIFAGESSEVCLECSKWR